MTARPLDLESELMNVFVARTTALLFLAMAMMLASCGKEAGSKGESAASAASAKQASPGGAAHGEAHSLESALKLSASEESEAGIRIEMARMASLRGRVTLSATIQPNRDRFARVAPRIPGRVIRVIAKLGDEVRPGQVLAELDSVELGESHSSYLQAVSQATVAKADFERLEKLYGEQVVSQKDFLRAKAEYEKSRAALQAASDKLRMMGVSTARPSKDAQSILPVSAPFAGTVIEKNAVLGDLAQPDKALFTIADLSTVWIEANLYEKDLARISVGASAEVTVTAYPSERFHGRLAYIGSAVEKDTRTIKGRIEVPNPKGSLKPEMFATVTIEAESKGEAIAVPSEAIVLADGKKSVFVKDADGFELREVDLGEEVGALQVVKAGLSPGDAVVVAGTYALKARMQKSKIGDSH